jgi:hypothetical protein
MARTPKSQQPIREESLEKQLWKVACNRKNIHDAVSGEATCERKAQACQHVAGWTHAHQ